MLYFFHIPANTAPGLVEISQPTPNITLALIVTLYPIPTYFKVFLNLSYQPYQSNSEKILFKDQDNFRDLSLNIIPI